MGVFKHQRRHPPPETQWHLGGNGFWTVKFGGVSLEWDPELKNVAVQYPDGYVEFHDLDRTGRIPPTLKRHIEAYLVERLENYEALALTYRTSLEALACE